MQIVPLSQLVFELAAIYLLRTELRIISLSHVSINSVIKYFNFKISKDYLRNDCHNVVSM